MIKIIGLFILSIFFLGCRNNVNQGISGETLAKVRNIHIAIEVIRNEPNFSFPEPATTKNIISSLISTTILGEETNPLDGWGNELLIEIASEQSDQIILNKKKIGSSVAVWSIGENGINEYGEGDDLVSWKTYGGGFWSYFF